MGRPPLPARAKVDVSRAVIDASIAIKWVVEEEGTTHALALRSAYDRLLAPDLLASECANVLWKKASRGELTPEEAQIAARLLACAEIELVETRAYLEAATMLAIQLNHPAYDCMYLALATAKACPFVTADQGFVRKIQVGGTPEIRKTVALLGAPAPKRES
jgi:predicted nucleic acid-binding protein